MIAFLLNYYKWTAPAPAPQRQIQQRLFQLKIFQHRTLAEGTFCKIIQENFNDTIFCHCMFLALARRLVKTRYFLKQGK
jgi:hypothetical protein